MEFKVASYNVENLFDMQYNGTEYKEYIPNNENTLKYNSIKNQWQEVYGNQLSLVDRGLTTSMWKAPGI